MCFSATVSFGAAAILTATGIFTASQTTKKQELPLACFPFLFAIQQFVEGMTWLHLTGELNGFPPYYLSYIFLLVAEVIWPFLVPLSLFLIEPKTIRRQLMFPFVIGGIAFGLYLWQAMHTSTIVPEIQEHHIRYRLFDMNVFEHAKWVYFAIASIPFLLTSYRWVMVFGIGVIGSFIFTYYYAQATYISVWCFFAAILSVILAIHFWREKRLIT